MENNTFFDKLKQFYSEKWCNYSTGKKIQIVLVPILVIALLVCFFATDLSARIFNAEEYRVYEYALECVKDELKFPNTAGFPSFKNCSIKEKSKNDTAQMIINSWNSGKGIKDAWDVSGYGTCENALGMTLNYSFNVTVVLSYSGELWCYMCDTSL